MSEPSESKDERYCKRGHPITGDNALVTNKRRKDGTFSVTCRECHRYAQRRSRARYRKIGEQR